jgi:PAS domain S-box-containing protein
MSVVEHRPPDHRDLAYHPVQEAEFERERQLGRFWDTSADLLAIIATSDGKPRLLNGAWEATLGYPAAALTQTRLVELVHPEDAERTMALAAELGAGRRVIGFENRVRHADGSWVWLSWNVARDDGLDYVIARDVSAEVAAKAALAASERQFRLLVAGVVDYALFMLNPQGIVTNWNAGAERIKGYRADEILGRHFSVFYTEADRAAGVPYRALETAREHGRYEAESWRVRKNGDRFWASVVIDAIRDETGQLVGFAKITRDMTERREAQLELQRAQERLAQAQKLEAIGQLTGGVAHDFNNILMVVGGQSELLRQRIGGREPAVDRAVGAIELAAARGRDLTRHLLAFARRQRLQPAPVALSTRAGTLRQLFSASVGSAIAVEVDLPDDLWPIEVDIGQLELALINLAVNARDAMSGAGRIELDGRNLTLEAGALEGEKAGDYVALTLRDTGSGIAPDILPKVFEPFFTTKDVDKGTGLGLSQVYGFVQQSGGRISIASELGHGAAVTLYLPRIEAHPDADESTEVPAASRSAAEVLLVEDNPQVADVAARLLDQLGHHARWVGNAEAALRLLEDGERPQVILSDIVMAGGRDGVDLAREVRQRWPQIPVLLATGYSERMRQTEFPILPKPYGLAELGRALDAALDAGPVPAP